MNFSLLSVNSCGHSVALKRSPPMSRYATYITKRMSQFLTDIMLPPLLSPYYWVLITPKKYSLSNISVWPLLLAKGADERRKARRKAVITGARDDLWDPNHRQTECLDCQGQRLMRSTIADTSSSSYWGCFNIRPYESRFQQLGNTEIREHVMFQGSSDKNNNTHNKPLVF